MNRLDVSQFLCVYTWRAYTSDVGAEVLMRVFVVKVWLEFSLVVVQVRDRLNSKVRAPCVSTALLTKDCRGIHMNRL